MEPCYYFVLIRVWMVEGQFPFTPSSDNKQICSVVCETVEGYIQFPLLVTKNGTFTPFILGKQTNSTFTEGSRKEVCAKVSFSHFCVPLSLRYVLKGTGTFSTLLHCNTILSHTAHTQQPLYAVLSMVGWTLLPLLPSHGLLGLLSDAPRLH